jgi:hypothetical protein
MIDEAVSIMPIREEAKEAFNKIVMEILCEIQAENFKKHSQDKNPTNDHLENTERAS